MITHLIAYTEPDIDEMEWSTAGYWEAEIRAKGIDNLAEFAGRACYQSWDKPNPKTRSNEDYLANVIGLGHESVLAHASASFYVTGVSRSLTHELIRHRWLSFSELSQRYIDMSNASVVIPPAMQGDTQLESEVALSMMDSRVIYGYIVDKLTKKGLSNKQAREAARALLPGATETRIVVSGNLRAWRDMLRQRLSPHADAEMRMFAESIYDHLVEIAPNSMIGIVKEPTAESER